MILDKYKIIYSNGFIQYKNLISHKDYEEIIKPAKIQIHELELKKNYVESGKIKKELKNLFGEFWFTNESPLFKAITTGFLEPSFKGMSEKPIKIIKNEL